MAKARCPRKTKKGGQCKGSYWAVCGVHKPGRKKTRKRKSKGMGLKLIAQAYKTKSKPRKKTEKVSKKAVAIALPPKKRWKGSGRMALPLIDQVL